MKLEAPVELEAGLALEEPVELEAGPEPDELVDLDELPEVDEPLEECDWVAPDEMELVDVPEAVRVLVILPPVEALDAPLVELEEEPAMSVAVLLTDVPLLALPELETDLPEQPIKANRIPTPVVRSIRRMESFRG